MLKREGIQFQMCKNPDVKCSVVERSHRTIRDRIYKYFTYKNSYRYGAVPNDRFRRPRDMEEDGGQKT